MPEEGLRTPLFFPFFSFLYGVEATLLKRKARERNRRDLSMEMLAFIPLSVATENTLQT